MSDEEKKAIEELKACRTFWEERLNKPNLSEDDTKEAYEEIEQDNIILNLIEKQSKEIEELKEKCKKKNKTIETMQFIKAIKRGQENTLLITEEQCAIKNKYMIEVSNGEFVDANELYSIWKNSVSEDKVKEKIEEARKKYNDIHRKHLRDCGIAEERELAKIEFGQSLLEKE